MRQLSTLVTCKQFLSQIFVLHTIFKAIPCKQTRGKLMRAEYGTPIHKVRLQSTDIWQYVRLVTAITIIFLTATASAVQSSPTAQGARKTAPHKTAANGDKATVA